MKKSLSVNALLNTIKTILGIIFPLVTFPYISRVLGVENVGKVNFSSSIVSYFTLIASFGVSTYAIREGSKIRDNRKDFSDFSNQVFTINVITTILSYLVLLLILLFSLKIRNYMGLIVILSTAIVFMTLGADWLNTIYEDFVYITVRTLTFQIVSLILMFVFVRETGDFYKYAIITVIASAGGNICNFFYCKKYSKLRLVRLKNVKKHITLMSMFFMSNITTIVFLNLDMTMLGMISGDYNVGLYSIAVKIYSLVKNIFTAILTVMMPRFSYMQSNDYSANTEKLRTNVLNIFVILVVPMAVGLFCVSDGVIALIGGSSYIEATPSLRILSVSILCAAAASFMTYIVVIPEGKEKVMLAASATSAVINVVLNIFLIPLFHQEGAAVTTVISEFVLFAIELKLVGIKLNQKSVKENILTVVISSTTIVVCTAVVRVFVYNIIVSTVIIIVISILLYFSVLYVLKNEYVLAVLYKVQVKQKKKN
ncbi:flippase [Enterococcus italicus]|uniref:flippase n=1 Tax=Enterococcus italicus TaxID=246144 RepID=UPI003F486C29